ncbi:MAG: esterase family protein [Phycisphaerales bacterium]|nr:esterase family protein [Phycisphaerales bacterium]
MLYGRSLSVVLICLGVQVSPLAADTYTITLDPAAAQANAEPRTGRIVLFFITKTGLFWDRRDPIEGPFFEAPQPIASIEVKDFKPGDSASIEGSTFAFPESLDKLDGKARVQAILDSDQTERSHEQGPGNVCSDVLSIELSAQKYDQVKLTLNHVVPPVETRPDSENLRWVTWRSELLSDFYGRDVFHRAGVALPKGYSDPNSPRQQWPVIFVVPAFGERHHSAENYAAMLGDRGIEENAPIGVYVVLDPEAPLGHHGFADSANNGPRATALIKEFIPYLETQFRLVAKPEARLIMGHSSGAWSALWLQLNYPEVFGGCWASAPDPVAFSAFQMTDLYTDISLYTDADGNPTPSYRRLVEVTDEGPRHAVLMTVKQECLMEYAVDPAGRSGQQWDAWESVFSPKDSDTGQPKSMFDPLTGVIDKSVLRPWSKYDITQQLMEKWQRWGPAMLDRVHLVCGDEDSFYLNRAVVRLIEVLERLKAQGDVPQTGTGYVEIIERADHGSVMDKTNMRRNREMREHLQKHGLQDSN